MLNVSKLSLVQKSARVIEKGERRMETSRDCTVDGPEVPNPIRSTLRESSVKLSNFNSVSKLSWRPNTKDYENFCSALKMTADPNEFSGGLPCVSNAVVLFTSTR